MTVRKIGIMGGTFNPIHIGHLIMAQAAMEEYELDKVLFIPAKSPYYKDKRMILPEDLRLKLVYEAVKDNNGFEVSDIEIKRDDENTYTIDTLRQLEDEGELFLIVGQDSLEYIDKWKESDEIFKRAMILAAGRIRNDASNQSDMKMLKTTEKLKKEYGAVIELIDMPYVDISSTMIREKYVKGSSVRYLVNESVRRFLEEHREEVLQYWKENWHQS